MTALFDRLAEGALVVGQWERRVWLVLRFRRQLRRLNRKPPW